MQQSSKISRYTDDDQGSDTIGRSASCNAGQSDRPTRIHWRGCLCHAERGKDVAQPPIYLKCLLVENETKDEYALKKVEVNEPLESILLE